MITEREARQILIPHHGRFHDVMDTAWTRWVKDHRPLLPFHTPTGRANLIHDLIEDEARKRFAGLQGAKPVDGQSERFLLNVEDRILVQFKLLDQRLLTRNYPTRTAISFEYQQPWIDGMPTYPHVSAGYCLDRTGTDVEGYYIVCAEGKQVEWFYRLERAASGVVVPYPPVAQPELPLDGRLVHPKGRRHDRPAESQDRE